MKLAFWFVALAVATPGCLPGEMHPGDACGRCHAGGRASAFGVAGTVYSGRDDGVAIGGATIDVVDADGRKLSMRSNAVGNFYATAPIRPPLRVTISKGSAQVSMVEVTSGDCNRCHDGDGKAGPGRIHLP